MPETGLGASKKVKAASYTCAPKIHFGLEGGKQSYTPNSADLNVVFLIQLVYGLHSLHEAIPNRKYARSMYHTQLAKDEFRPNPRSRCYYFAILQIYQVVHTETIINNERLQSIGHKRQARAVNNKGVRHACIG